MKILFHISSLFGGGAERVMSYLINHNCELNNEVYIVVCYEKEGEYYISPKAKKIVIGSRSIVSQSLELRKTIKRIKPDICVSFMQGGNIRLSLACMGLKQKYILSVRNDPKKEYPNAIMQKLVRYWFDAADGVVFQTEDAKKFFCSSVQNKSSIIYNPVSNQFFRENVSKDTAGIVAFGRLVDQKNFAMLIKAYAMIADRIDDDLYIYGEGPLEKRLYEIINSTGLAGRIHLMGRTNNVPEVLKTAKVYALSSDFEGMPNALLEAVCMLVPVVSTDCPCGGPKEICSNECGLLSPVGDVESFANNLYKVSNSEQLRAQLVKKCIERRNAFSNDSILKKWDAFFDKVCGC